MVICVEIINWSAEMIAGNLLKVMTDLVALEPLDLLRWMVSLWLPWEMLLWLSCHLSPYLAIDVGSWALAFCLKEALKRSVYPLTVIVEVDLSCVISWASKLSPFPSMIADYWGNPWSSETGIISFVHSPREVICEADELAKRGIRRQQVVMRNVLDCL